MLKAVFNAFLQEPEDPANDNEPEEEYTLTDFLVDWWGKPLEGYDEYEIDPLLFAAFAAVALCAVVVVGAKAAKPG